MNTKIKIEEKYETKLEDIIKKLDSPSKMMMNLEKRKQTNEKCKMNNDNNNNNIIM